MRIWNFESSTILTVNPTRRLKTNRFITVVYLLFSRLVTAPLPPMRPWIPLGHPDRNRPTCKSFDHHLLLLYASSTTTTTSLLKQEMLNADVILQLYSLFILFLFLTKITKVFSRWCATTCCATNTPPDRCTAIVRVGCLNGNIDARVSWKRSGTIRPTSSVSRSSLFFNDFQLFESKNKLKNEMMKCSIFGRDLMTGSVYW